MKTAGSAKTPSRPVEAQPTPVFEFERHSDRRRRQFVEVASHLIETEGPEAVRMPRVAELAGCTRTLVYRYFPRREDLLFAVLKRFYDGLAERVTEEEHSRGMAAIAAPDPAAGLEATIPFFEAVWDTITEIGISGLILRETVDFNAKLAGHLEEHDLHQQRWAAPLRASGLSELSAAVAMESANGMLKELFRRWKSGEIERQEAIELSYAAFRGLVGALRERDQLAARAALDEIDGA